MTRCCDTDRSPCSDDSDDEDTELQRLHSAADSAGAGYAPLSGSVPAANASYDDWAVAFPLSALPDLPNRQSGYWMEPLIGSGVVGLLSALFATCVVAISIAMMRQDPRQTVVSAVLITAISTWALVACASVAFIVCGGSNEIKRSRETCYPIPAEVTKRLLEERSLLAMTNVKGLRGRTYCVRCLVWRPPHNVAGRSHHCHTCQRCVTQFDHHCGVFGRCIVGGNMPCFYAVISMLFAGIITVGIAAASSGVLLDNEM